LARVRQALLCGSWFCDVRVINVVDLMKLQPSSEHPHGLSDFEFDALFTADKPIIFAFHGYPSLIHRLRARQQSRPPAAGYRAAI
jgi:xylulose-5-phosphate/fructose-6-phosphate phosphoketolase